MYFNNLNRIEETHRRVAAIQKSVLQRAYLPIVTSREGAIKFIQGAGELAQMPKEEVKKIKGLSPEELKNHPNAAVRYVYDASKSINDFLFGYDETENQFLGRTGLKANDQGELVPDGAKRKEFFTNTLFPSPMSPVYETRAIVDEQRLDMAWMSIFNIVDARGQTEVMVSHLISRLKWYRGKKLENANLTSIGRNDSEKISYEVFSAGVLFDNYDSQSMVITVNQVLTDLRITALANRSRMAYEQIFLETGKTKSHTFNPGKMTFSNWEDKAVFTISKGIEKLRRSAQTLANGTLGGGAFPIFLVAHGSHMYNLMRLFTRTPGEDGSNFVFRDNIIPIFSYAIADAVSGAINYETDSSGNYVEDEFGYRKVKKAYPDLEQGLQLVLPRINHHHVIFSDLSFGEQTNVLNDSTVIVARERNNTVMDANFKLHVKLPPYSEA